MTVIGVITGVIFLGVLFVYLLWRTGEDGPSEKPVHKTAPAAP